MLLPCLIALAAAAADTGAPSSLIGSSLLDAQRTEFFTFFNLGEESRQVDSTGRLFLKFKPRGGDFRSDVTLRMVIEADGVIDRLDLELGRAFINSPRSRVFARDVANSFLLIAAPEPDASALRLLAQAIWGDLREDRFSEKVAILHNERRTAMAYSAFTGSRARFLDILESVIIAFDNTLVDDTPTLVMGMARKR